ncbi:aminodeoxychorismate synthase, component I [Pollutimonas subterranea]|uniref:Aminodeoxychorismate synthase, component I n=1 Tax=Pollutimonas subterranea TaxID=2045210 RepID=A0A2N4U8Z0_9BURK|nr:aminodeoxychorismate synthase component I [Pollutimonas subterranea]PLC51473.1 aminodeoxychorismate synthase, component I [Pollutimonas subterranea]
MLCRFEDRLSGRALELLDLSHRIQACSADELPAAFADIEAARRQGYWVALLLDYELGEWLEPAVLAPVAASTGAGMRPTDPDPAPRLTALVYGQAARVPVWSAPAACSTVGLDTHPLIEKNQYLRQVEDIRASIGRGELYQANYTFPIRVATATPHRDLYRAIAARHPAGHAAYIEDGSRTILSFSPELFFARKGATLTVRPMKGTAPRHADPVLDQRAAQELLRSEKNRAENLMIVDLLRNDLGRLATPGSVKVDTLFSLECYPSVWTLTSTISAQAPDKSLEELLRALFPCGSITGAPKIAAMKKIRKLEVHPRGIYCGSVGWLAPDGDCSLNVAIRTIVMQHDGSGRFGVGGGIVYDSDAELEWQECQWKARLLQLGGFP